MTIKECIDIVDNIKPNQYTVKDKVMWLSFIDEIIINEVLRTHEGYDGRYDSFEGYSEDKLSVPLIVSSPYDRLYTAYLKMKIDGENGETARYNNSAALYNTYMLEYRKHYNKTHMPLSTTDRRDTMPPSKANIGLSDAEYENLKKDLTYVLTEYFSDTISEENIYAIVTAYMQNNAAMLKGNPGYTPKKGVDYFTEDEVLKIKIDAKGENGISPSVLVNEITDGHVVTIIDASGSHRFTVLNGSKGKTPVKGVDYWNDEDKAEVSSFIKDETAILQADIDGLHEQINEEAHFRGYLSTNAKIQALEATPNDFAYSAESGTKWIYDERNGWQDSGTPVPDQLTPASGTVPLINGTASVGTEEAYARGDHRHPTDTSRVSVEEFNTFKGDLGIALDSIISMQNELIGGDA